MYICEVSEQSRQTLIITWKLKLRSFDIFWSLPFSFQWSCFAFLHRAAMGGKAAKAWSLAGFWKIENSGGSEGAQPPFSDGSHFFFNFVSWGNNSKTYQSNVFLRPCCRQFHFQNENGFCTRPNLPLVIYDEQKSQGSQLLSNLSSLFIALKNALKLNYCK